MHGWTHRPKALGGTDPIDIPTGAITWAKTYGVGNMTDAGTTYPFEYLQMETNDTANYEPFLSGGLFKWIQINNPGYYMFELRAVSVSSVYSNANPLFLEGSFLLGGSGASMRVNMGAPDFSGMYFTQADQLLAGNEAPSGLYTRGSFNYNPASPVSDMDFESPLRVSGWIALAGGPGTLNLEVEMFVMRICDEGYTEVYP